MVSHLLPLVAIISTMGCEQQGPYPQGPYGYRLNATLPNLSFESGDGAGGSKAVHLQDYYEPDVGSAQLLVLRVGAGWCGTCRWHLGHSGELLTQDFASSISLVDLMIADDDNVPATPMALPSYRRRIDMPQAIAIDPEFQLRPAMVVAGPLPFFVIVDRRTMKVAATLNDPDPEALYGELRGALGRLNGAKVATTPSADEVEGLHRNQWDMLRDMLLPTAPPPDPTNAKADDPGAAVLGKALFSDASLSPTGDVSCATCHDPSKGFADGRAQAQGVALGDRNSPAALFASHSRWQFWDGRADSLWSQALGPFENPKEFNSSRLFVVHAVFDRYRASYEAVFGTMPELADLSRFPSAGKPGDANWGAMTSTDQRTVTRIYVDVGKSIAAFERTLRAQPNAVDRYVGGDLQALTAEQKKSLQAFFSFGCVQCHYGPRLTDDAFHVVRFPSGRQDHIADAGRKDGIAKLLASEFLGTGEYSDAPTNGLPTTGIAATPNTVGAFKTPALRGVADTPPYGHGGSLATLLDVAKNYGTAGLDASDPGAVGESEPWLPMFLGGHASELVPFLEVLSAEPMP